MSDRLFIFVCFVLVYSIYAAPAYAAERTAEQQQHIFTNQDIEKYKNPSEAKTSNTQAVSKEDSNELRDNKNQSIREDREKESWCKRASAFKKKIKKADESLKETEKEINEENSRGLHSGKKAASLKKRLVKARKKVDDAEADLGELEDEAHRKGVPPGWLRCQK